MHVLAGMIEDLKAAVDGAVILLHACAHNPTGVDPTEEQWEGIRQVIRSKHQLPFFDCAYQVSKFFFIYSGTYPSLFPPFCRLLITLIPFLFSFCRDFW